MVRPHGSECKLEFRDSLAEMDPVLGNIAHKYLNWKENLDIPVLLIPLWFPLFFVDTRRESACIALHNGRIREGAIGRLADASSGT